MKILVDHPDPFFLAHGGFQRQIEQTTLALSEIGVDVENVRWWDDSQNGDVLHYFGRPSAAYVNFAHQKRLRVVLEELLTGLGSRNGLERLLQRSAIRLSRSVLPSGFTARLAWDSYGTSDACVAKTGWEADLMISMFGAPGERVHCIPNGVESEFLEPVPADNQRGKWLVCTATITERKRPLETAQAAVCAGTPIWIVGEPYSQEDDYAKRFMEFARQHSDLVRYEGGLNERVELAAAYREARGFVLLSTMETLSLSALEARACGCPVLLSKLPWATTTFGRDARYCPVSSRLEASARHLREFYEQAPGIETSQRPAGWDDIAREYVELYEQLLSKSW
jgi:glycosyltransferase involved in cell wall biosynthesis